MRSGKDHVAGGGENQSPLENTNRKKQTEQLIPKNRPSPGRKDELPGSNCE